MAIKDRMLRYVKPLSVLFGFNYVYLCFSITVEDVVISIAVRAVIINLNYEECVLLTQ